VFSAECIQFGAAEANLAMTVNHQSPLLFAFEDMPTIQLCIERLRANVLSVKPAKAPDCGREGRIHNQSPEPKALVRSF
jgi:hypothetical protein